MKNTKELKRSLLRKVSKSFIGSIETLIELVTLREFILEPSDENYVSYVIARLGVKQDKLIKAGIPENRWPPQLRGEDWASRIGKSFGLKKPPKEEIAKESELAVTSQEVMLPPSKAISEAPRPIKEAVRGRSNDSLPQREIEKPLRVDNPFKSDSFGTVLGETGDPFWDEIQKMKREKRGN